MGPMPTDMLFSFDQLKVLNLSGNHLQNTSLTLLDPIGSLEVSRCEMNALLSKLVIVSSYNNDEGKKKKKKNWRRKG